MWRKLNILCMILVCIYSAMGQQDKQSEKQQFVAVPPENLLLVIASQPDCPLQFENAKLIVGANNTAWGAIYQIRNRGTKPISVKWFNATMWFSSGGGGSLEGWEGSPERLILPGQTVQLESHQEEIIPLTDELRGKLQLRGSMKAVAVLMVEHIKFTDGTTYSDERTRKALQTYFENLSDGHSSAASPSKKGQSK